MTTRERRHDDRQRPADHDVQTGAPTGGSDRADAQRLLAHAADAIDRALSRNSAAFLSSGQQTGGQ